MSRSAKHLAIIGDGGWGTGLGVALGAAGRPVRLWGHEPEYLARMERERENPRFLPGVKLPPELRFEADLEALVAGASLVVSAVPTRFLRPVLGRAAGRLPAGVGVVSLTKGLEPDTLLRPSQILAEILGPVPLAALSGPSHAEEVARGLPASVVVASTDPAFARLAQELLMTDTFRIYTSADLTGVELGGALKNVVALAAGICVGLKLGDNALSALVTRGLAEIARLGAALGCEVRTFSGLSGLGDLITTCVSPYGRNRAVGLALGQGRKLAEILAEKETVAEGVAAAAAARELGRRAGVELPIIEQVCLVLHEGKDPRAAVADLMARDARPEADHR